MSVHLVLCHYLQIRDPFQLFSKEGCAFLVRRRAVGPNLVCILFCSKEIWEHYSSVTFSVTNIFQPTHIARVFNRRLCELPEHLALMCLGSEL